MPSAFLEERAPAITTSRTGPRYFFLQSPAARILSRRCPSMEDTASAKTSRPTFCELRLPSESAICTPSEERSVSDIARPYGDGYLTVRSSRSDALLRHVTKPGLDTAIGNQPHQRDDDVKPNR